MDVRQFKELFSGLTDFKENQYHPLVCITGEPVIGSHSVIKGGAIIGHHTVVAAGTVVDGLEIPPFSLVSGNPMTIKAGYYKRMKRSDTT